MGRLSLDIGREWLSQQTDMNTRFSAQLDTRSHFDPELDVIIGGFTPFDYSAYGEAFYGEGWFGNI